jgi:hypothetical protein
MPKAAERDSEPYGKRFSPAAISLLSRASERQ